MSTNTFDRPLEITDEEDIKRFWAYMESEPKPLPRLKDSWKRMKEEDDQLQSLLSSFSCEQDRDIQNFLHNRAMLFERLDKSRTYLIADDEQISAPGFKARNMTIYGYITLSIKNFKATKTMSNRVQFYLDNDFLEISHIPDGDIEMVQLLRRI